MRLFIVVSCLVAVSLAGLVKREADKCHRDNLLVGGEAVEDKYIMEVKSVEDCIAECNKVEACRSVNFFPEHFACLRYSDDLLTVPDLQTREEDKVAYVIVKGCGDAPATTEDPFTIPPN